jgi:hypothetical protein
MQHNLRPLTSLLTILTCALVAFTASTSVQAQDNKADPSGTWTWSQPGRDGAPGRVTTLKLKADGEKLTGTISGREGTEPTAIDNGKVKGDEISFAVTREVNGNKRTMKYSGKVSGDSIKGKFEFDRNGEVQSRNWEAKRATEKK